MRALSKLVQNELLWLPPFEFQEITAGRFEKSVGGRLGKAPFVFVEDFVKSLWDINVFRNVYFALR